MKDVQPEDSGSFMAQSLEEIPMGQPITDKANVQPQEIALAQSVPIMKNHSLPEVQPEISSQEVTPPPVLIAPADRPL